MSATYAYVANSHDASTAVTAVVTPIRIVWANTLGAPLRQAEHGVAAQRTFRFRHTGNLQAKFAEARQVLGMTINYQQQLKELADRMASEPIAEWALERSVLRHLWTIDHDLGKVARANQERRIESVLAVLRGRGPADDRTGTARRRSASRSTPSPSTSTMAGGTPAGPTRSSGRSRTRR